MRWERWWLENVVFRVLRWFWTVQPIYRNEIDCPKEWNWSHVEVEVHKKGTPRYSGTPGTRVAKAWWVIGPRSRYCDIRLGIKHDSETSFLEFFVGLPFLGCFCIAFPMRWLKAWMSRQKWLCWELREGTTRTGVHFYEWTSLTFSLLQPEEYGRERKERWFHKFHFYMPWTWRHQKTEILDPNLVPIYTENDPGWYTRRWQNFWNFILRRKPQRADWAEGHKRHTAATAKASQVFPYQYVCRDGTVQDVQATVYVTRRTWGWQNLPFVRMRQTAIDVRFSEEVGEARGSYKGGCTGCGYNMRPGETPEQTLRRMETERRFSR